MQGSFNVDWEHQTAPEDAMRVKGDNSYTVYPPDVYFWVNGPHRNRQRVFVVPNETFPFRLGRDAHALKHYIIDQVTNKKHAFPEKQNPHPDPTITANHGWSVQDAIEGIDYITPSSQEKYGEVGQYYLIRICEEAERNDFAMAQTIQGLLGVGQNMVWACLDPEYNPIDRIPLMKELVLHRISEILKKKGRRAIEASLMEHKRFCKTWVWRHFRNLTPMITSAASILVQKCMNAIPVRYHSLGCLKIARILWRNERTSGLFHECVYHQICANDTTKNGRNPSYKQMNTISNMYAQSYYKLIRELKKLNWQQVTTVNPNVWESYMFHPDVIDWYDIVRQFPEVHQQFKWPEVVSGDSDEDVFDHDGGGIPDAAGFDQLIGPPGLNPGPHAQPAHFLVGPGHPGYPNVV